MADEVQRTQYARLSGNVIDMVIESETDPDGINGEWVACGDAGPGWTYDGEAFHAPAPVTDPRVWWLDISPLRDRFDTLGYPGLKALVLGMARTNDVCYAVVSDLVGRLYVDILGRRPELAIALQQVAAQVQLAGKPAFTPAMQAAILQTPTTEAERYIKGLG